VRGGSSSHSGASHIGNPRPQLHDARLAAGGFTGGSTPAEAEYERLHGPQPDLDRVFVFDVETGHWLSTLQWPGLEVTALAWDHGRDLIASLSGDGLRVNRADTLALVAEATSLPKRKGRTLAWHGPSGLIAYAFPASRYATEDILHIVQLEPEG
jgi:hypothetical protein